MGFRSSSRDSLHLGVGNQPVCLSESNGRMYPSAATDTTEMVEFDNPEAGLQQSERVSPIKSIIW